MNGKTRSALALALALVAGCGATIIDGGGRDAAPGPADAASPDLARPADLARLPDVAVGLGTLKGTMNLTYYWVAYESSYTGTPDTILCDTNLQTITTVAYAFARALSIEGTGRLNDGRLLNAASSCQCPSGMTVCYFEPDPARYPWGVGAGSRPLRPYRSVAVDRNFIALGTKLYIAQFDGLQMPASYGFVHDGCVSADDVGGGITGMDMDFFVGERINYLTLDRTLGATVTAYVSSPRCP